MSDTSLVFNLIGRDRGVNSLLAKTAGNVRQANIAGAAATVALGGAMGSAAAYAVALGSSVLGAVGAVGLLPAAVGAAVAISKAAGAVTYGLGEAWKATGAAATVGGGAAAAAARRVTMAQREVQSATQSLADAQRSAREAQEAITRARMDEAERLSDLTRSLAGARLDEESAVLAVANAQKELQQAQSDGFGDTARIAAADLAYRQSLQTLDEVRDRVDDLGKDQAEGGRKGVEGSDAVLAALRRQEEAQRAVAEAALRLADSQTAVQEASAAAAAAGVDPAAEALNRLSPAARDVITTLRQLAPAWQDAARFGQQHTFAGVAGDLRDLSGLYLPMLTDRLGQVGDGFNTAIRNSLGMFQTKQAAGDVDKILAATASTVDRLALAVRPAINGLLQWAAVGSGFLPGFAGGVTNVAETFERWSIASRESGKMQEWISNAVGVMRQLWAISRDVGGTVLAIFRAGDDGGSTLDALERGAALMRQWAESREGQEQLRTTLESLRNIIGGIAGAFTDADNPRSTFTDGLNVAGPILKFAADHTDMLAKALPWLAVGYLAAKSAQTAANIATVVTLPLRLAEVAATWGLRSALRANTAATIEGSAASRGAALASGTNTAATAAGDAANKRSIISLAAQKVAMVATNVATKAAAAGQWLLNVAMSANPVGLVILAIVALIAIVYLLWTRSDAFRNFFIGLWEYVSGFVVGVAERWWDLFTWFWGGVIDGGKAAIGWFVDLPGRIGSALATVGEVLTRPFKAAFNGIAYLWNRTLGSFSFTVPDWIPGVGGHSFSLPQLPYLAKGGTITGAGLAVVGEEGPEVVSLGAGASVIPLPRGGPAGAGAGAGGPRGDVRVIVVGGDRDAIAYLRRLFGQHGFGVA